MALVKSTLKSAILNAFKAQQSKEENPDGALDDLADKLSAAIESYVKSATVSTTVTGACATPAGPGTITGSGTGTLS
jgi:hypothetical protein